jgi:hypothetical protein
MAASGGGHQDPEFRTQTAAPGSWGAATAESQASRRRVRGLLRAGRHIPHDALVSVVERIRHPQISPPPLPRSPSK